MIETILLQLASLERPLVLISDPDNLLRDETALVSLLDAGYAVVNENNLVARRREFEQHRANPHQRIAVITPDPLNYLPYDLWQQGHHVTLALHAFFPNLDYPTIEHLQPGQRRTLSQLYADNAPAKPLSPGETQDYLLRVVFDAAPDRLAHPAALLLWLDDYHRQAEWMGADRMERLVDQLKEVPALAGWPLRQIFYHADAYRQFVRDAWQREVGQMLGEGRVEYQVLPFGEDEALQDSLPRLVRTGTLTPVTVDQASALPQWAAPAVAVDRPAGHRRQLDAACDHVEQQLQADELRWDDWQAIARRWADLTRLRYDYDFTSTAAQRDRIASLEGLLDGRFTPWLQTNYTPLAQVVLPKPHHVFHAHRFSKLLSETVRWVALLVLDGMSLADWQVIREAWTARHPYWSIHDHLVLAQIPSITAVSRQALVSGRRPDQFADTLTSNRAEAQQWSALWQREFGSTDGVVYETLSDRAGAPYPAAVDSQYTRALCMVSPVIDAMVHGATVGTADVFASVKLWLQDGYQSGTGSSWFEALIGKLLANNFHVMIASDHGHVEALGKGQPQEGVLVETRSKRARLYNNLDFARAVQVQYPDTILWQDDGLLPAGWQALMPAGRTAFAPQGQRIVSHGGLTIEEMIVPLISIEND